MAEAIVGPRRSGGLLAVSAVFLLGMACGAALFFAGARLLPGPPRFSRPGAEREGRMPIDRMAEDLGLDSGQQEKVRAVLERSRTQVREILEQSRKEVRTLLRPDQQEKFDRMRPPRPPFPGERPGAGPGGPPPGGPPPGPGAPPPPPDR